MTFRPNADVPTYPASVATASMSQRRKAPTSLSFISSEATNNRFILAHQDQDIDGGGEGPLVASRLQVSFTATYILRFKCQTFDLLIECYKMRCLASGVH